MNSLYFHINNGGVVFSVVDAATEPGHGSGPMVKVQAWHFGHPTASTGIMVKRDGLKALANFFAEQAGREFSEEYCVAASAPNNTPRTSGDTETGNFSLARGIDALTPEKP